ncbi:MAG: PQQ-binding-like beta-propeller repeat protein, partial [Myxococcota bacterium]
MIPSRSSSLTLGLSVVLLATLGASRASANEFTDAPDRPRIFKPSKRHIFGTQWSAPIVRRGFFRVVGDSLGTPGVAEKQGVVIVGTGEGELRGYRLGTGELLWTRDTKVPFLGPVTVIDEGDPFAVATQADGLLLAFEITTGEPRWESQLDG